MLSFSEKSCFELVGKKLVKNISECSDFKHFSYGIFFLDFLIGRIFLYLKPLGIAHVKKIFIYLFKLLINYKKVRSWLGR